MFHIIFTKDNRAVKLKGWAGTIPKTSYWRLSQWRSESGALKKIWVKQIRREFSFFISQETESVEKMDISKCRQRSQNNCADGPDNLLTRIQWKIYWGFKNCESIRRHSENFEDFSEGMSEKCTTVHQKSDYCLTSTSWSCKSRTLFICGVWILFCLYFSFLGISVCAYEYKLYNNQNYT